MGNEQEHLESVVAANMERVSESVRQGEEQLASGEPLKTLDEIAASLHKTVTRHTGTIGEDTR